MLEIILLWLISPIILIPMLIHYAKMSKKLSVENDKLSWELTKLRKQTEKQGEVNIPQPVISQPLAEVQIPMEKKFPLEEKLPLEEELPLEEKQPPVSDIIPVKKEKKEKQPGAALLFSIGVFFVLLAGTVFATTTWQILPAAGKIITLLLAVAVFYVGSYIAYKKLDLKQTGIAFYFLGSSFLSVTNLSVAYFGWVSDAYSFKGNSAYLVWGISIGVLAICLMYGKKLFGMHILNSFAYILGAVDVILFTLFFTDNVQIVCTLFGVFMWASLLYFYKVRKCDESSAIMMCFTVILCLFQPTALLSCLCSDSLWGIAVAIFAWSAQIPVLLWCGEERKQRYSVVFMIYTGALLFLLSVKAATGKYIDCMLFIPIAGVIYHYLIQYVKKAVTQKVNAAYITEGVFSIISLLTVIGVYEEKEALPVVFWLLSAGVLIFEFVRGKNRESVLGRSVLLGHIVVSVMAAGFINTADKYGQYLKLFSLALIAIGYVIWTFVKKEGEDRIVNNTIGSATGLINIITFMAIAAVDIDINRLWVLVLIVSSVAIYVCLMKNGHAWIPALSAISCYGSLVYMIFEYSGKTQLILLGAFLIISIIVGRIFFKHIVEKTEDRLIIDWSDICCAILAAGFIYINSTERKLLLFYFFLWGAVYLINYYKRTVSDKAWRYLVNAAAVCFGFMLYYQPFFDVPKSLSGELVVCIVLLVVVAGVYIWKNYGKFYNILAFTVLTITYLIYTNTLQKDVYFLSSGHNVLLGIGKLVFLLLGAGFAFLIGHFHKNRLMLAEAGIILLYSSFVTGRFAMPLVGIVVLLFGAAYGLYLCMNEYEMFALLPILQAYAYMHTYKVPTCFWLIAFLVFLAIGYTQHTKVIFEEGSYKCPDWFTFGSVVPVIYLLANDNSKWGFCAMMMLSLLLVSLNGRLGSDKSNRIALSLASVICGISLINQPLVDISAYWDTEWVLAVSWAVISVIAFVIYKDFQNEMKYIFVLLAAVVSVMYQGIEAMHTGKLSDALVLGITMALLLVYSYLGKRIAWFLLAGVTLIIQGIYCTRDFWKSIAWWIYLLAVGIIFIAVAARSEYIKHNDISHERKKLFAGWNRW